MAMIGFRGRRLAKESAQVRALKLKRKLLLREVKSKYLPREKSRKPKIG